MPSFRQIIKEIHRRSLWQVLGIYLAGSWVALEVVGTLTETLSLPGWFPALALVLAIAGLPVVLATAFVHEENAEGAGDDVEPGLEPTTLTTHLTWGKAVVGGLLAMGLLAGVGLGWTLFGESGSVGASGPAEVTQPSRELGSRPSDRSSVAVLPFTNMGAAEDAFLSEGITEEIIAQLAQVPGLKVISRTSVVALEGASLTLPQIADTLGVDHVLEGSVRRAGEQARITVQLIEADSDAHLWASSYTRDLVNLFEVQEEIAREVTRALVESVPNLRRPGAASRTANPRAYEAYLRGRQALHRRTREGLLSAMESFEEATIEDSTYAPAYAGHAAALGLWVTYGYPGIDFYDAYARALNLAARALELDPESAQAYAARAYVLTKVGAPAERVNRDFQRALELQPNSADIHGWYAHLLTREGDDEAALREADRAIELDPIAPGRRVGFALDALNARRYDLAREQARQAAVIQPDLTLPRQLEAFGLVLSGRPEACLELDLSTFPATEAICLDALGRKEAARDRVEELTEALGSEGSTDQAAALEELAAYYAWVGDAETSLRWVERAFEASPRGVDYRYVGSGLYDRVLSTKGFRARLDELRRGVWEEVQRRARESGPGG